MRTGLARARTTAFFRGIAYLMIYYLLAPLDYSTRICSSSAMGFGIADECSQEILAHELGIAAIFLPPFP